MDGNMTRPILHESKALSSSPEPPRPSGHHSPGDAVGLATNSFFGQLSEWSLDQLGALAAFRMTVDKVVEKLNKDVGDWLSRPDGLESLVKIFDSIFFRGKLIDVRCEGATPEKLNGSYGRTSTVNKRVYVYINSQHGRVAGDASVAISVISTVLHECVHAYFVEAACNGINSKTPCTLEACQKLLEQELGKGGHGESWHYLGANVEREARKVLGMEVQLGREAAAIAHFEATGEVLGSAMVQNCFAGRKRLVVVPTTRTRDGRTVKFQ
ncbi:hypothetical protein LTR36_005662 [Oleoguttula mirabilis]|uniref:SprT-like domain-containing protein n=1 Tax=Oleoguttula mirabilis TaxID=1507867 RepID=A0AAV9JDQ3_9PEZI|nr:hypothetical protein LTR36_005662 [Oleoguttula mirabilis]